MEEPDQLQRLVEVVRRLRDPKTGCPWDSVQTNDSIRRYLVEEMGEYLDALEEKDYPEIREELGDLLLQVVLNSQILEDEGRFGIQDVARTIADKMVRRHPHVFGNSDAHTTEQLQAQWLAIKNAEPGNQNRTSALDGLPRHLPALQRAQKLLGKAAKANLSWQGPEVDEALAKLKEADTPEQFQEAVGPLLFSIVSLCRAHDVQAEETLQATIAQVARQLREQEQPPTTS